MHLGRIEFNIVFVYGLVFRFRLPSPPPLNDAVTFSYGQASVPVRKGLSPFCWCVLSGAPILDWSSTVPLEADIYASRTRYDALNRPAELTAPDKSVIRP